MMIHRAKHQANSRQLSRRGLTSRVAADNSDDLQTPERTWPHPCHRAMNFNKINNPIECQQMGAGIPLYFARIFNN